MLDPNSNKPNVLCYKVMLDPTPLRSPEILMTLKFCRTYHNVNKNSASFWGSLANNVYNNLYKYTIMGVLTPKKPKKKPKKNKKKTKPIYQLCVATVFFGSFWFVLVFLVFFGFI